MLRMNNNDQDRMRRCFASFNRRCCMIPHQARRGDDTEHERYGSPLENVTNQVGEA